MGMRIVTLIVLALAASGCGQATGSTSVSSPPPAAQRPSYTVPAAKDVTVSGGTMAQRALIRRILAGMGPNAITSVVIAPTEQSWHPVKPGDVTVRVTTLSRPRFLGSWQATLLGGAFRDMSAAAGLPRVTVLESPGGSQRITPANSSSEQVSDGPLEHALREGVRRTGAELVVLRIVHPDGPAALVVMRTERPAWFLRHRFTRFFTPSTEHMRSAADGIAEVVVDGAGRLVAAGGGSSRLSEGWSWVRSDLQGCDPFVHSVPLGYNPPPCPAA